MKQIFEWIAHEAPQRTLQRGIKRRAAALRHLDKIIEHVVHDMEKAPGPGWEAILDLLCVSRDEIEQELNQRGDA
jgi:hypothetical protein